MKIIVRGDVIETDLIYRVGEISKDDNYSTSFKIYFLNSSTHIVSLCKVDEEFINDINTEKVDIKIQEIRDFVISHWNSNNLDIPRID